MIDKSRVKKILCIKLKGIGDVLLSTIVLPNLHEEFPNATIDFLTEKPSVSVLESITYVNKVLVYRPKEKRGGLKAIWQVRKQGYDLVFDFYSNPRTALITFLSGARYRVGFPYRGRAYAYNLYGPQERGKYHAAQLHLEVLRYVGVSDSSQKMMCGLNNEDIDFARGFMQQNKLQAGQFIVLSPSGGWASKKCDPEVFAGFGKAFASQFQVPLVIVWGPEDYNDAQLMASEIGEPAILAPATTFRQMGALMKFAACVCANDSGPMHLAVAVDTPTLSLHGPTEPQLQGPFGDKHEYFRLEDLSCIGCNLLDCPRGHECFRNMQPDMVTKKLQSLLQKNSITLQKY